MILSFIIPIYNGEKTIAKCLDSIRAIKWDDIEIIAINDGSTDNTQNTLENISPKDNRLKIFTIQNSGECGARNYGLEHASGDYISFVDSDDWIDPHYYNEMLELISQEDKELVYADYYRVESKGSIAIERVVLKDKNNDVDVLYDEMLKGLSNHVWGNIYSNRIIKKNMLRFKEGVRIGGDALFNIDYVMCCSSVYYFRKYVYYYNAQNENSVMHNYDMQNIYDYIRLFDYYQQLVDKCPHLYIDVDREYYLSRLFKCLFCERKIDNNLKKMLKDSRFLGVVTNTNYCEFRNLVKVFMIKLRLM